MTPILIRPTALASINQGGEKLSELLQAFAVLTPPERVIHVGTGSSKADTVCWLNWPLSRAIVIFAEEQGFESIVSGLHPDIKIEKHHAVLAEVAGSVDYFCASNTSENGLVDPSLLKVVWPSLTMVQRLTKDAVTLDSLAESDDVSEQADECAQKSPQSWLIVDCLPAARILSGAMNVLKDTKLVCVRALSELGFRGEPIGADVKSIDTFLGEQGFKRLAFVSGLNSKIGYAVYGRSSEKPIAPQELPFVKALHHDLELVKTELVQAQEEFKRVHAELTKERDAFLTLATELEAQLLTDFEKHAEATSQQLERHKQTEEAFQAKLTEAQKQTNAQTQVKDKVIQELADSQKTIEATQKSLAETQTKLVELQKSEAEAKKVAETTAAATAATAVTLKQAQANQLAIQAKLDAAIKDRDVLQARAAEQEAQLKTVAEQHAAATAKQLEIQKQAENALQAKLTEAQKQTSAETQAKDKVIQELVDSQNTIEVTQKSLAETQSKLVELQKSEAEAKKVAETTAAATAATAVTLKQAQANQLAIQAKLDAAIKERDTLQARAAEQEAQLKTVAEQHAEATAKHAEAFTKTKAALQAKFSEAQEQIDTQTQVKNKAFQQLAELQNTIAATQKSLTETKNKLAEIQKSEAEAKNAAETTAAVTAATVVTLHQVQASQQAVQAKLDAAIKERDALQARAAEHEIQFKIFAEQLATGTAELASANTQHAEELRRAQEVVLAKLSEAQKQTKAQAKDKPFQQLPESQKSVTEDQKS